MRLRKANIIDVGLKLMLINVQYLELPHHYHCHNLDFIHQHHQEAIDMTFPQEHVQ